MTEFGKGPLLTVAELGAMGYKMVLYPLTAFRSAMKAAADTLTQLRDAGHQRDALPRMMTRAELYDLLDYPATRHAIRRISKGSCGSPRGVSDGPVFDLEPLSPDQSHPCSELQPWR